MNNLPEFKRMVAILWERGMTYSQIAKEIGVVERTIYKWLAGDRKVPKTVINLMRVLTKAGD